jgi:hypothetical protein
MPLLRQQLQDFGILISAGQISNLLTKGHDAFHTEKAAVKQSGLETARWISVDDTGARHLGVNGVTTQVGDDRFTSFDTVGAKSRLMFLMTLRGAFQDYVINPAALLYLHEHDAPETLIDRLIEPDDRVFADEDVWTDHLISLHFEYLSQRADEAPTPRLRAILARAAAEEMVFANAARAHADDLIYDYDDGA